MIARHVDEHHIARGYDPYNSADQPWVLQLVNYKREVKRLTTPTESEMLDAWRPRRESDAEIDAKIRRGFQYLENHPQIAAEIFSRALEIQRKNPGAIPG